MNSRYPLLCAALAVAIAASSSAGAQPADTLTFAGALQRVLDRNPSLAAALARTAAADGAAGQAHAWPNPSVSLEAENVGGGYSGLDHAELTFLMTQEFELGGKRGARGAAARALANVARFDARADSLELRAETRRRYADVLHAEEQARIALRSQSLVEDLVAAAHSRVAAGAAPVSDRALAAAALARAQLETAAAETGRLVTRRALASLWGDESFSAAVAALPGTIALRADSAASWAARGPAVTQLRLETDARRAEHAVERSLRVPSVSTSLGVRRVQADDAGTFLAALSFPLPVWDRRGDAVSAAQSRVNASQAAARRQLLETTIQLSRAIESSNLLRERLRATQESVVPRLREAVEGLRSAYQIGSASYPDLLAVQSELIDAENRQNDARRALAAEITTIERLTGRTIEELGHE